MGEVFALSKPDPMDDPSARAETYFAEALRMVTAAGEAIGQVKDESEQARLRSGYLAIANEAIEGMVDSTLEGDE